MSPFQPAPTSAIQAALHKALVLNGPMSDSLYAHELREHVPYWYKSMRQDKDDFLFVVTEHNGDVAMLLIHKKDGFFMNEDAREHLQKLWKAPGVYLGNMLLFIPQMAQQLNKGEMWVMGLKIKR